jgi:hypothetical protein
MKTLKNISLTDFRRYLISVGCERTRTNGGHEIWTRKGLARPIVLQSHIDPVPEFIIKKLLGTLGVNKKDFLNDLNK